MSDEALNNHLDWLDKCAEEHENESQDEIMTSPLIDRIDRTRESWASELDNCRNEIIDTVRFPQNPLARLVVEFDYLLVEAKLAIIAENEALKEMLNELIDCHYGIKVHHIGDGDGLSKEMADKVKVYWEAYLDRERENKIGKLRVWNVINPPSDIHWYSVDSPEDGARLIDTLAVEQLKNSAIHSNTFGMCEWDGEEWTEWDGEEGNDIDETTFERMNDE